MEKKERENDRGPHLWLRNMERPREREKKIKRRQREEEREKKSIRVHIRGFMAVREKTIEVHIYGCENVETKREREKKIEKKTKGRREREENDTSPH